MVASTALLTLNLVLEPVNNGENAHKAAFINSLSNADEQRYNDLAAKESKGYLTGDERHQLRKLEERKFPHGKPDFSRVITPHGIYEKAPYHGSEDNSRKAKAPEDGQEALNNSYLVKNRSNGSQRIAVQGNEFAIFDEHRQGIFHGHVRNWQGLSADQKNVLIKNKLVDPKSGKIK
jgi:hypothetical protein